MIADLRELQSRTGDERRGAAALLERGAGERRASSCGELLGEIGLEPEVDEAGNVWAYLPGDSEPALAVGSHLDSVPTAAGSTAPWA